MSRTRVRVPLAAGMAITVVMIISPHLQAREKPEMIRISGTFAGQGEAAFDLPFYRPRSMMPAGKPPGDTYALQFRDRKDRLLDEVLFGSPAVVPKPFEIVCELPQKTQSIWLVKGQDILTLYSVTAHEPTLTIKQAQINDGELLVEWTSEDRDRDPLDFMIMYAPSVAEDRLVLIEGHTQETFLTKSLADQPSPKKDAAVVVRVSDGFHFTEKLMPIRNKDR